MTGENTLVCTTTGAFAELDAELYSHASTVRVCVSVPCRMVPASTRVEAIVEFAVHYSQNAWSGPRADAIRPEVHHVRVDWAHASSDLVSVRSVMLPGEGRRIAIPRARWRAALGDRWPEDLAPDGGLGRCDVFDVADAWRAGRKDTLDLVVASMAWGYGPVGYGPRRTATILDSDPTLSRLDTALLPLRADHPDLESLGAAYTSLLRGRPNWVRGLGPAFSTKLLYFAGYRRGSGQVQPLILDSVVAGRLPAEAGTASTISGGWSSEQWLDYLRWAHRSADGGEPDRVEMDLFDA